MKMIKGAKYMLMQNISVGTKRFDAGEVFTLVFYIDDSELATVEKDGFEYFIAADYLKLLNWSIPTSDKPAHYDTGIDTIAFMRANCPPEQVEGFLRGNAIKYLQRYDRKSQAVSDLKKCRHYLDMLIEEVEGRE